MLVQTSQGQSGSAHVVVLGNEKSASSKSTVALHGAVALLKVGQPSIVANKASPVTSTTEAPERGRAAPATISSSRFTAASSLARPCEFWITKILGICAVRGRRQ